MLSKQPIALIFLAVVSFAIVGFRFSADQTPLKIMRLASENGATYINPVIDQNFPDPSVLKDRGMFYTYSTNAGENMPCQSSADLVHWTLLPDAMPNLPDWAKPGRTWAPNVRALIPGERYIAYFAAWDAATNQEAVGAAAGPTPSGPFSAPSSAQPLVQQSEQGGAIDPSCFVNSDGSRYLVWKNDGNSRGRDTWLWIQKLSGDGLHLVGAPTPLIEQDQRWEGNLIEAPTLWKHRNKYYLFYSANDYSNCNYAVGYAVSDSLLGPYVKPRTTPWLASTDSVCGPGGEDIVTSHDGTDWMAYHTWAKGPRSYRSMSIDRLRWVGDVPVLDGPSHSPQSVPK